VPLQFKDDLWIHPGDILVGDQDGVVVVPPSLVDKVVALCQDRKDVDDKILDALSKGETMENAMKRFRK
jgi:regulator of RNase E activity RraA